MIACFIKTHRLNLIEDETLVYPKSKEELSIKLQDDNLYFTGKVKKVFVTQT